MLHLPLSHRRRDRRGHGGLARGARAAYELAIPVEPPEVWCAGVTYERSRDARVEESDDVKDVYTLVYDAERPELFLKDAGCRRTVGPGEPIGVRSDSAWDVPEPEIGVVLGERGELAGLTIGNDVSSRAIEGENPLYLAQAKIFAGACALGPAVLVPDDWEAPLEIRLRIADADGNELFAGRDLDRADAQRTFPELVEWLLRDEPCPARQRDAHWNRPRPPGRLHPRAGPRRRDPRPGHRHPDEPRRHGGANCWPREGAKSMSEVLEAPARPAFANFVGGEWRQSVSGATYEKRGPWRPSEVIGEFPASGEEDVNAAVAAAAAAFPEWARLPAAKRGAILNEAADAIEARASSRSPRT